MNLVGMLILFFFPKIAYHFETNWFFSIIEFERRRGLLWNMLHATPYAVIMLHVIAISLALFSCEVLCWHICEIEKLLWTCILLMYFDAVPFKVTRTQIQLSIECLQLLVLRFLYSRRLLANPDTLGERFWNGCIWNGSSTLAQKSNLFDMFKFVKFDKCQESKIVLTVNKVEFSFDTNVDGTSYSTWQALIID